MRKYKKLLLILLALQLHAGISADKQQHMIAGMAIYGTCILSGGAIEAIGFKNYFTPKTCVIPVILAGVGKEWYDYQHPKNHTAEFADTMYTILPALGVSVVFYRW